MKSADVFAVMAWVATGTIFLSILIGTFRWKRLGHAQVCLMILLSVSLLAEFTASLLMMYDQPTYPVFHIYAVIEYALLAWIFVKAFKDLKVSGILKVSIPLMIGYALLNTLIWQPLSVPNTNVVIVSGLIIISISTFFLFRTLDRMVYQHIEKSALFWISISVLVYFASTVLMFAFLTKLIPVEMNVTGSVLILNAIFNIIHYLCFSIALWMKPE